MIVRSGEGVEELNGSPSDFVTSVKSDARNKRRDETQSSEVDLHHRSGEER
jgi:hypothetical protein